MDELLKGMLTEAEFRASQGFVDITVTLDEFIAEIDELQKDFALLEACDGDHDKFRASLQDDCLNEEMSALLMRCMHEEEDTQLTLDFIDATVLVSTLEEVCVNVTAWNYPVNEPKILSSRAPGVEYINEMRAQNNLRRRNAGKRILSSRG